MRFTIERTSGNAGEQPCEGAEVLFGEWRCYRQEWYDWASDSFREWVESWVEDGDTETRRNVVITDAGFSYEERDTTWYIEIPNLEALMALIAEHGPVIVSDGHIEIYDDYRE